MTTDVKALIDRMRFQLQREGLKSAVRGALSDAADALTALFAENERLRGDVERAELGARGASEACVQAHVALTAMMAKRDRAQAALLRFVELDDANTLRDGWNPGTGYGTGDYFQSDALGAAVTAARATLANPSETPNGSAAPSPVMDEMAEVLREALHGGVSLVAAREALTAALGRKP